MCARAARAHNPISMPRLQKMIFGALPVLLFVATAAAVAAQETPVLPGDLLAQQSLRASRLVFIAYAIVIVLIMAWAGSISKRLGQVEDRLGE